MRVQEPTYLTAYASQMKLDKSKPLILEDGKLSLSYDERYFFDHILNLDITEVVSFALKKECPLLYMVDKQGSIHLYDTYRDILEKEIFKIEIEKNHPVDMAVYKNVLYILGEKSLRAFSLITWQLLWESTIENLHSMSVDEDGVIYIAKVHPNSILILNSAGELVKTTGRTNKPSAITTKEDKLYIFETKKISILPKHKKEINLVHDKIFASAIAVNRVSDIYVGSSKEDKMGTLWQIINSQKSEIIQLPTYTKGVKKIQFDVKENLLVLDNTGNISLVKVQKVYQNSSEMEFVFDSTFAGCKWHRMEVSFEIPRQKGVVSVYVMADDTKNPAMADAEIFENKKDIYLHNINGRYLHIRIRLQSDPQGEASPVFERIKVYFPKETYLKYLPSVYSEDTQSKELLQRYLSIYQAVMEEIEEKITNTHLLIDPQTTPDSNFLNWLSLWLGLKREQNWSDEKWRELLAKAVYFFKRRGTREGLSELIELYTQIKDKKKKPIIIEPFQTQCANEEQIIKLGKYTFCVLILPKTLHSEEELQALKRIVTLWKPAHTKAKVSVLKEKMLLGSSLYLGINSKLNEGEFILGESALSIDSRLEDSEQSIQIQSHARVGMDTYITY